MGHRVPELTRECRRCGSTGRGAAPACAPARAQYGPGVLARATALMLSLLGVAVSVGFMATVRRRAAVLLEHTFSPRVRALLRQALHADETSGRAAGGLRYIHVAATEFLTACHTGGRAKTDIDAGGVLGDYAGTVVRDGYAGYTHLIEALTSQAVPWLRLLSARCSTGRAFAGRDDPVGLFG